MFWEEEEDKSLPYVVPDAIIDLSFSIKCKSLPLDHAWKLSEQIITHLPWLKDHETAAIHQIHVAESNNGWLRPETDQDDALLYPSRRTKLTLRIPLDKLDDAQKLSGKTIEFDNTKLVIGSSKKKLLTNSSVIFSRYTIDLDSDNENDFLSNMAQEIYQKTNFKVKKMLCGKENIIKTPGNNLLTRHLMIADLDSESSIKLQQLGLGTGKHLGCGIFLPHKGIKSLNPSDQ